MKKIIYVILATALLFACGGAQKQAGELKTLDDIFYPVDIDTNRLLPQALRVLAANWQIWSLTDSSFAALSQDIRDSTEYVLRSDSLRLWIESWVGDSLSLDQYFDNDTIYQTLSISGDTLYISDGNSVSLAAYIGGGGSTNHILDTRTFGAVGDGVTDNTTEIQTALDSAETLGGGTVLLPPGTVLISNDSSAHANAMLLIPEGVSLIGWGRYQTVLTRASSKRGNNGIFIAPKGYDTATVYNAAGNFTISDFTITDGAITPNRAIGDLIALAHSENVIIERMGFGNHDQHAIDIHGSKNIIVRNCVGLNNVVASSDCATFQIEAALSGGVWGSNADGTGSKDIYIENNDITNTGAANTLHLFHGTNGSSQVFSNINLISNRISGAYAASQDVIGSDDNVWANVNGLLIDDNTIIGNHKDARLVNLYNNLASASFENIIIHSNFIQGSARGGIYLGGDVSGIAPTKNIVISGNAIDINSGSSTLSRYAIYLYGSKGVSITNNVFEYLGTTIPTTSGIITVQSAKEVIISDNRIDHNFTNAAAGSGVIFVGDPATTGTTVKGSQNYINRSSTLGGASFAASIKKSSLGTDDIININGPIDPQYLTSGASVDINFNESESAITSIDYSGSAIESTLNLYNPKSGGQYKIYLTDAVSDSIVFPDNVITYKGDTLKGRICNTSIFDLYYDGTNYIATDTIYQGYDPSSLPPLILDTYSGAVAVYALRAMYSSWTDSTLIVVRRSSDDAEAAFTAAEITDGTLTTWTGANDGFVTTIRDQSGSGFDVTQTTDANQPQIVSSGSLVTKNSLPALDFDGTNDGLTYAGNIFASSSAGSAFSVFSFNKVSAATREVVYGSQDVTGPAYDFLIARQTDDERLEFYVEGDFRDNTTGTATTNTNSHRVSLFYENTVLRQQYLDGVLDMNYGGASSGILDDGTAFFIGQQIGGSNYYDGLFQEVFFFDSNQTSNRTALEGNQATYYGL